MTPERKKKLRLLLRRKAAEELKRQQEVKANERRRVITQRTGDKKNLDSLSDGELSNNQYHIYVCIDQYKMTNLLTNFFRYRSTLTTCETVP